MPQDTPDLFGHSPAQGDLFAGESSGVRQTPQVDPDVIRRRLKALRAAARATQTGSAWTPETTRLNWLPGSERDQLRIAFEAEPKRLDLAA